MYVCNKDLHQTDKIRNSRLAHDIDIFLYIYTYIIIDTKEVALSIYHHQKKPFELEQNCKFILMIKFYIIAKLEIIYYF